MSAAEILEFHVPRGVDWREYAMCKGRTELFFAKKAVAEMKTVTDLPRHSICF